MTGTQQTETPREMLDRALHGRKDPKILLAVAERRVEAYTDLAARAAAGEPLDGRVSIYTGETYEQARDRWDAYLVLLVNHLDGGGH